LTRGVQDLLEDFRLQFTSWKNWKDRDSFEGSLKYPGVYSLALSDHDLTDNNFSFISEIVYFGMTNSIGGLKSRLRQFDRTLHEKHGHGGALRVISNYPDYAYEKLLCRLYVSIFPIICNVNPSTHTPNDLRNMGLVADLEYECFARYLEKFHKLPIYNDKKKSPKTKMNKLI
jgi:hypothetical protein